MSTPPTEPAAPTNPRFEILHRLGAGSMGVVYAAYDRERDMPVALKTMRSVTAKRLYRFKREFRALQALSHPNIVDLHELIARGDEWLLTMELVEGCDFIEYVAQAPEDVLATARIDASESRAHAWPASADSSRIPSVSGSGDTVVDDGVDARAAPLAPARASSPNRPRDERPRVTALVDLDRLRACLAQLATALHVLHRADVIHRDLKPSNVMVTHAGRVVLMDFGVVAELERDAVDSAQGSIMGTPAYMAPEQGFGRPSSAAADWYAFGVMIYRALTGLMPFQGPSLALLVAKRDHEPTPVDALVLGAPAELAQLCMRLLSRRPHQRPGGAEILRCLGVTADASAETSAVLLAPAHERFVGRAAELHRAPRDPCRGRSGRVSPGRGPRPGGDR